MRQVKLRMKAIISLSAAVAYLGFCLEPASAQQSVEAFYRGKNIDLYVGYSAGGLYDVYARLVARHMERYIPGGPKIIPKQMTGAGSRVAANFMYSVAPKDGTALATGDQSLPLQQALGEPGIQFDATKFNWIGNPIADNNTTVAWHTSGVRSIEDAKKRELPTGATGNNTSAQYPQAMNELLGTKFKLITGYPGGVDINLALERGEVAVRGSNSWSAWKASHSDWLKDKKIHILVQIGLSKEKELPDVPLLMDLAGSEQDHAALKLLSAPTAVGRPIFSTPGVPAERVKALRDAFDNAIKDERFIAEAKQAGLDLNPVSGEELQKIVVEIVEAPKDVTARLNRILAPLAKQ